MCKGPEAGNRRLRGWVCWQRVVNESLLPGLLSRVAMGVLAEVPCRKRGQEPRCQGGQVDRVDRCAGCQEC